MRAIGSAERAFELMCRRAHDRHAFGGPLAEKQFVQDFIATSRIEIDQARLMVLHAAWRMDTEGKRAARQDISMIKVIAAQMHQSVLDRAMQVHGALGMSDDIPLAAAWRQGRWLRIADGPDEVHKMVIALREIAQSRLGPGRIHHCMRAIGSAERAFELMCERAHGRGWPSAARWRRSSSYRTSSPARGSRSTLRG